MHRLYVKGTVEERIIDILKAQKETPVAAAEAGPTCDYKSGGAGGKRKRGDAIDTAVGSLRADRQKLRLVELEKLFSPFTHNAPLEEVK